MYCQSYQTACSEQHFCFFSAEKRPESGLHQHTFFQSCFHQLYFYFPHLQELQYPIKYLLFLLWIKSLNITYCYNLFFVIKLKHPPIADTQELDKRRRYVGYISLFILVISFSPTPIMFNLPA